MSIDLHHGGAHFGKLALKATTGAPGVRQGILRVTFDMELEARAPADTLQLVLWAGALKHATDVIAHVIAEPDGRITGATPSTGLELTLQALVRHDQLRHLDEVRDQDGGLQLMLDIRAVTRGPTGNSAFAWQAPLDLTASDWRRILKEMKWQDRVSFDAIIEGGPMSKKPFDEASKYYREALDAVESRSWTHALTQCRKTISALKRFFKTKPFKSPERKDWTEKQTNPATSAKLNKTIAEDWSLDTRIAFIRDAVQHATHAGPHSDEIGEPSPDHARLVVAVTGLLLDHYARR